MRKIQIASGQYRVGLFFGDRSDTVVYSLLDPSDAEEVFQLLPEPKICLAAVSGADWDRQLSPWPEPKAFRGGKDFGGEAEAFLRDLTETVLPETEKNLPCVPVRRGIAGYSLAGLFALWSLYRTDAFSRAASASGSLWYDGFLDYMRKTPFAGKPECVYLSLGDREKVTKSPRMAAVEDCTREAAALLEQRGTPVVFRMNPGGHFQDANLRLAAGIRSISEYSQKQRLV